MRKPKTAVRETGEAEIKSNSFSPVDLNCGKIDPILGTAICDLRRVINCLDTNEGKKIKATKKPSREQKLSKLLKLTTLVIVSPVSSTSLTELAREETLSDSDSFPFSFSLVMASLFIFVDSKKSEKVGEKTRALRKKVNELRQLRNQLSQSGSENANQVLKLKKELSLNAPNLLALDQEVSDLLSRLPNLPSFGLPNRENKIIAKTEYSHDLKHNFTHEKILRKLALIDEEKSILLSGSKFAVYQGFGSQLLHALINFMRSENSKRGYRLFDTPYLVKAHNLYNTGQFHKFQDNLYKLEDSDFYLLPTAEVCLVNLYQNQILTEGELPLNLCAYSPCFRAERMAAGQENKGLTRLHQFHKVELVKIVKPENSYQELEALVADVRHLLHSLKISHRVVELCNEELGFSAAKTYDLEVWLPASKKWLEISSCSNCEDFQSRRAQIRIKNQEGKKYLPHTLNGSALAVDRLIATLCEYYYNEKENRLIIPEVLKSYFVF
ncbi:20119_t:CDS:2 [Cetraspora pellucida]|uniref:Serine--tRNA ligase n=1 Tax=Cetraspora pellucida TaxID=1433469 RepID=A0A9N8W385_9GLOM|nr:20119_t:CDS:2 [Cetraspora pellucida]